MALTCKLTTPELQERKRSVISKLKALMLAKTETASGFSYRFHGDDETLDLLNNFIKTERMCCDFFTFKLIVTAEGMAEMELSGPIGTKDFIVSELQF